MKRIYLTFLYAAILATLLLPRTGAALDMDLGYDQSGRLTHVSIDSGQKAISYQYDGDGNLVVRNSGSGAFPKGDVSGDGKTDIVDALFIARHAVGLSVPSFNEDAADVNCNGQVDIVDALLVARKAVGLSVPGWCGQ